MSNANKEQLIAAATLLKPLLTELVFVGGAVTGLLITDAGSPELRATFDVDAIAEITSYAEYNEFAGRLRALGLQEDTRQGAPMCRWIHASGTVLDVMPLDKRILGFSNRWYRSAMDSAVTHKLTRTLAIRVVTAPLFLATKIEAFKGRGQGDFLGSRDLEDLVSLVDGRSTLVAEVRQESIELRKSTGNEIGSLLAKRKFRDALPGHLPPDEASQARLKILISRLEELTTL